MMGIKPAEGNGSDAGSDHLNRENLRYEDNIKENPALDLSQAGPKIAYPPSHREIEMQGVQLR